MQNLYYTDLDTDAQRLQQPVCCISRGTQPRKSPVGQLVHLRWLQLDSIFTLLSSRDFDSSYPAQLIFYFAQKKGLNYHVRFELRRLFVSIMNTLLNFRIFQTFIRWKKEFYIRFYGKIFEPPFNKGPLPKFLPTRPPSHCWIDLFWTTRFKWKRLVIGLYLDSWSSRAGLYVVKTATYGIFLSRK